MAETPRIELFIKVSRISVFLIKDEQFYSLMMIKALIKAPVSQVCHQAGDYILNIPTCFPQNLSFILGVWDEFVVSFRAEVVHHQWRFRHFCGRGLRVSHRLENSL